MDNSLFLKEVEETSIKVKTIASALIITVSCAVVCYRWIRVSLKKAE
jgi:hypothetical protein